MPEGLWGDVVGVSVIVGVGEFVATDAAENASTQDAALTMSSGPNYVAYTGQALYSDAAHTTPVGQLIGGTASNYYFWDFNGNGTGNDQITHDYLDGIFTKDVNGNANPGVDTTDTYRYGVLYTDTGDMVKVALLTVTELVDIPGMPSGWFNTPGLNYYWSAAQTSSNKHSQVDLNLNFASAAPDSWSHYVAVQVL